MWIQYAPGVTHLAYGPDGRTLYSLDTGGALTAWDIAARTGRKIVTVPQRFATYERGIHPLADGQRIVRLDFYWATVYDANTGHELGGVQSLTRHSSGLRSVTPEGRLFYIKTGGVAVAVWNFTTRDSEPAREIPKAARRGIRNFDVSNDEQLVALIGLKGSVAVYDWGNEPELSHPCAIEGTAEDARFSPDGRTLALFSGRQVRMWDLERGAPRSKPVFIHAQSLFAFHPTAPVFAALDRDKTLTLFSTETGEAVRSLDFALGKRVTAVCFSPDGLTCAVGGSNRQFAVFDVDL